MKNIRFVILILVVAGAFISIGVVRKGGDEGSAHKIAVITKGTCSVYWKSVRSGALKAGRELGYEIFWNEPELETDPESQIQIVNDFIDQNVAGIVLAPNDSQALVPVVEKMFFKNIPCVIVDSGLKTDKYLSFAATDNYQGGAVAARRIGEILAGKGKVIILMFIPNSDSTELRVSGFMETINQEFPDIEIVDRQYGGATIETALAVSEDMLNRNKDIDGLFTCNALTATAAAEALGTQGRTDSIKMVGFGAEPVLIDNLKTGVIDSLVLQDPFKMGYIAVKSIAEKLAGKKVSKEIDTGVWLIRKENLDDPEVKELLNLQ